MYVEAEVPVLLISCFAIVIFIVFGTILRSYLKTKSKSLLCFLWQAIFTIASFIFILKCFPQLSFGKAPFGMESETYSVNVALSGILWAVSMGFMLCGILKLLNKK